MMKCGATSADSKPRIFENATPAKGRLSDRIQLKFVIQLPSRSDPARGTTFTGAVAGTASAESARMTARPPAFTNFWTRASIAVEISTEPTAGAPPNHHTL